MLLVLSPAVKVVSEQPQQPNTEVSPSEPMLPPSTTVYSMGAWSGLFEGSLTAKGVYLAYVALKIVEGKTIAQLDPIELDQGSK